MKGGGAGGGSAAGMYGFFNANLVSGFPLLAKLVDLENEIEKADLIFTAEGKIDQQSINQWKINRRSSSIRQEI